MAAQRSYLFVSYSREDLDRVRPVIEATRRELAALGLPVELWVDLASLKPGEVWDVAIADASGLRLGCSSLSPSVRSAPKWVLRELAMSAVASDKLIIPVLLDWPVELPSDLANRQWLDLSGPRTALEIETGAGRIAQAVREFLTRTPKPAAPVSAMEAPLLAADFAEQARASKATASGQEQPTSVFVVHGRSPKALAETGGLPPFRGLSAAVLSRLDDFPQSLFQKFWPVATRRDLQSCCFPPTTTARPASNLKR
ncbi:MAG TPA: toll/interleukin-1 receptor domain-containing protein [Bryobacteraceae bacterium]|nr:toll/interleukin-1 receptor domain-containing protein [Bryobacteraceae bacterium]